MFLNETFFEISLHCYTNELLEWPKLLVKYRCLDFLLINLITNTVYLFHVFSLYIMFHFYS